LPVDDIYHMVRHVSRWAGKIRFSQIGILYVCVSA
jgi:hypothetical protein